jgi:hypothetical protein
LGQSIKELRPTADSTVEARRGEIQARDLLQETEGTVSDPVKTTKPKTKQGGAR